ncbi:MAG: TIM barrel protein [Candidatus Altiarchaeota archaeon]|nr:TIM barrel protein [Candidatus Altiarchaeota archaeon]
MEVGISTQIFWDYEKLDMGYILGHIADDLKFDCAEIHCQGPMFRGWGTPKAKQTKEEIKDILSTLDIGVSLHAPYHDLNIATLNLGVRKEVIKQVSECIETASYLGSRIVVVHPGYLASRKYRKEHVIEIMVRNFKTLARLSEDNGVWLCMENISSKPKALCVHIKEIRHICDLVDSDHFGVCLDSAHANTTGLSPDHFAEGLRDYVSHVHISDNTGIDDHLPIGLGNIDFEKFLKALKPYNGCIIIEGWLPRNQDYFLRWDKKQIDDILKRI